MTPPPALAPLLACPACRCLLDVSQIARCPECGRVYTRLGDAWMLLAPDGEAPLPRHLGGRFEGRTQALGGTRLGRLYRRLYVHPSRFLGDLQRGGITNYHRRLACFLDSFPADALLLDVGSGARRLRDNVITLDIAYAPMVDILADAQRLPLGSQTMDGIVVQQVLEHVSNPDGILAEVYRVLRPGGRLYCEVPFLYPVHDALDFRRWTLTGLRLLCGRFTPLDAGICIGPCAALSAHLRRLATAPLRSASLEAVVDLGLGWLLAPLKYLDELVARWPGSVLVAGGVYFEGVKPAA